MYKIVNLFVILFLLGSHSAMDSTVLSPLLPPSQTTIAPPPPPPPLPPPIHPPMIPIDHTALLSQIKTATRNSILLCGDNTSTTYIPDSGFDSSSSHATAPPPLSQSISSSTPCTAFMIQTQTGNALLIPHPQGTVNSLRIVFFYRFVRDCFKRMHILVLIRMYAYARLREEVSSIRT